MVRWETALQVSHTHKQLRPIIIWISQQYRKRNFPEKTVGIVCGCCFFVVTLLLETKRTFQATKMATKINSKDPVRLRKRKTSKGLESLYLDIYVNGIREYEYLKLYLIPETCRADREKNRQTLALAEAIRAKRTVEIVEGRFGFKRNGRNRILLKDLFEYVINGNRPELKHQTIYSWRATWSHVQIYDHRAKSLYVDEITTGWMNGFAAYLQNEATNKFGTDKIKLKRNTVNLYYITMKACVRYALHQGYISEDVSMNADHIKKEEVNRNYLTVEEVRMLSETEFEYQGIKRAFLFSCLTGLRRSDILALTWADVAKNATGARIIFRQKKTSGQEYLDINKEAYSLMGERGKDNEHIFSLPCFFVTNSKLRDWCRKAGITKEVSFHCARHTFATMMLTLGTDIYVVSKLLGHRSISTTQIYAKVIDKRKQDAVNNIPSILKGKKKP